MKKLVTIIIASGFTAICLMLTVTMMAMPSFRSESEVVRVEGCIEVHEIAEKYGLSMHFSAKEYGDAFVDAVLKDARLPMHAGAKQHRLQLADFARDQMRNKYGLPENWTAKDIARAAGLTFAADLRARYGLPDGFTADEYKAAYFKTHSAPL